MTPNLHVFKAKHIDNGAGAKVRIISERFHQKTIISYDYCIDNTTQQAIEYLESLGFDIIGKAESGDWNYIISTTFEPLK